MKLVLTVRPEGQPLLLGIVTLLSKTNVEDVQNVTDVVQFIPQKAGKTRVRIFFYKGWIPK